MPDQVVGADKRSDRYLGSKTISLSFRSRATKKILLLGMRADASTGLGTGIFRCPRANPIATALSVVQESPLMRGREHPLKTLSASGRPSKKPAVLSVKYLRTFSALWTAVSWLFSSSCIGQVASQASHSLSRTGQNTLDAQDANSGKRAGNRACDECIVEYRRSRATARATAFEFSGCKLAVAIAPTVRERIFASSATHLRLASKRAFEPGDDRESSGFICICSLLRRR
jgi:hypothetical protein